jgi:hypothetical protein
VKFVCQHTPLLYGLHHEIIREGHDWFWWAKGKPVFDVFDEEQPDVVIVEEVTPHLMICIEETKGRTKIVRWNNINPTIAVGSTTINTPPYLVDTDVYSFTEPNGCLRCELASIGPIDTTLKKLCYPVGEINIKLFGKDNGGGYGLTQYLGDINSIDDEKSIYASATLTYVRHTTEALKVLACRGLPITVKNYDVNTDFCVKVDDHLDIIDLIHNWNTVNPQLRIEVCDMLYNNFLEIPNITYIDYAKKILEELCQSHL